MNNAMHNATNNATNNTIYDLLDELDYAKRATIECVNTNGALVDMHGLKYWAERVEELRREIKEQS